MNKSIAGMKLKPHFLPVEKSPGTFRCVTAIRTTNEKFHGWVYRDSVDRNVWTNDRNDGRKYSSRTLAGRDLIERISL